MPGKNGRMASRTNHGPMCPCVTRRDIGSTNARHAPQRGVAELAAPASNGASQNWQSSAGAPSSVVATCSRDSLWLFMLEVVHNGWTGGLTVSLPSALLRGMHRIGSLPRCPSLLLATCAVVLA